MGTALINAKVYVEKGKYAEAVYEKDGIIKKTGSSEDILALTEWDDEIIDCEGRTVIPGLNDSHMHLLMIGTGLMEVNTRDAKSIDELVSVCRKFLEEHPDLCTKGLYSSGWNQDLFTEGEKRIPNRHDLDRISTEIPVILSRVCGHIAVLNTKAIEVLGLGKNPEPYPGGTIELEEDGFPSGVVTENCVGWATGIFGGKSEEDMKKAFALVQKYAFSKGITSVQSNDVGQSDMPMDRQFALFKEIYASGLGKLRYRHQVCVPSKEELQKYIDGEWTNGKYDDPDRLCLGPLKLFKDGSLGGRTGLMRHEYLDDPGNFGVEVATEAEMDEMCAMAAKAGMQVVTHVIGDEAICSTVRSYERCCPAIGDNPLRHGLVHCQITDTEMLETIARDRILAFYQPIFLDYDMHAVLSRCGEALSSTSYAFRSARELGIHVSYGTDSPVEDCDPFPNLYSAVTRKDKNGWPEGGFFPQECVDVETAIDDYTLGSAYAEFKEDRKGRLKPGFLADMVVLDKDIFSCDPMEIRKIEPVMTFVGGELVYRK